MFGGMISKGVAIASREISTLKKGLRKYTHCNSDNNMVDTCFKLHGYLCWHPKGKEAFQVSFDFKVDDSSPKWNLTTTTRFATTSCMFNTAIKLLLFTGNSMV